MSKADAVAVASASPQYRRWLKRERRGRISVRGAQLALLLVALVFWEVLPKTHMVNPLLTSYPSALWPTFLELLKETLPTLSRLGVLQDGANLTGNAVGSTETEPAARALGMQATHGTLEIGKAADFALWQIESPAELAYAIGANPCIGVVRGGNSVLST